MSEQGPVERAHAIKCEDCGGMLYRKEKDGATPIWCPRCSPERHAKLLDSMNYQQRMIHYAIHYAREAENMRYLCRRQCVAENWEAAGFWYGFALMMSDDADYYRALAMRLVA